jgi:hypothetical protein
MDDLYQAAMTGEQDSAAVELYSKYKQGSNPEEKQGAIDSTALYLYANTKGLGDHDRYQAARFRKSFAESSNFTLNMWTMAQAAVPDLADLAGNVPSDPEDRDNFYYDMDYDQRREWLNEQKEEEIQELYGNIPDRGFGTPEVAGMLAKAVPDLINLVPLAGVASKGMKAAMLSSGAISAVDVATYNLAAEGEIDAGEMAIGFGIGMMVPPAFEAGKHLLKKLRSAADSGVPVTVDEVVEATKLDEALNGTVDLSQDGPGFNWTAMTDDQATKLTNEFNLQYDLSTYSEANRSIDTSTMFNSGKLNHEMDIKANLHAFKAKEGEQAGIQLANSWGDAWPVVFASEDAVQIGSHVLAKNVKNLEPKKSILEAVEEAKTVGVNKSLTPAEADAWAKGQAKWLSKDSGPTGTHRDRRNAARGVKPDTEFHNFEIAGVNHYLNLAKDAEAMRSLKAMGSRQGNVAKAYEEAARVEGNVKVLFDSFEPQTKQKMIDAVNQTGKKPKVNLVDWDSEQMVKETLKDKNIAWTSDYAKSVRPHSYAETTREEALEIARRWAKASDAERSKVQRFMDNWSKKHAAGKVLTSPNARFEALGGDGKAFVKLLDMAEASTDRMFGERITRVKKAFTGNKLKFNEKNQEMLRGLLNKTVDPKSVPANVNKAYREIQTLLEEMITDAQIPGIYTPERAAQLLWNSQNKGYFPRIYDQVYLNSVAGAEHFKRALGGVVFKDEIAAGKAIKAMVGDKDFEGIQGLINKMEKDANGKLRLSPKIIERILSSKDNITEVTRSRHLERARSIPEEFEKALDPFLVDDFETVMTNYFYDTTSRIEYAKHFGKNDENMKVLAASVQKTHGGNFADQMSDVLAERVGDPSSKNTYLEQKKLTRQINRNISAFETLKLAHAPILSLGQSISNPTTAALGRTSVPMWKVYQMQLKASLKGLGGLAPVDSKIYQDTFEQAKRFGALSESLQMTAGSHSSKNTHSLANRKLLGLPNPLSIVMNPTKFLKAVGFLASDQYSRTVSTLFAKDLIEHMLSNKAKILKLKEMGKFTARHEKQLKKLDKGLVNMGLDPSMNPNNVAVGDLDTATNFVARTWDETIAEASAAFARDTQFSNKAGKLPEIYGSANFKALLMFKSFAQHQSKFVADHIMKPMLESGDFRPAINYFGVMALATGIPITMMRDIMKGDDENYSNLEMYFRALGTIGGLGLMMDTASQATYSEQGLAAALAGPVVSTAGRALKGVSLATEKGEIEPMIKALEKELGPGYKTFIQLYEEYLD